MTADARGPRRAVAGLAAAIALALAVVLATVLATRMQSGPDGTQAMDDDRVVATLQTASRAYSDELRALMRATRADPQDAAVAKQAARRLIEEGRAAGDSRLVGAALGVLRPFLGAPDAEVLYLSATALQYQHDFTGALRLLDQAITIAPGDADSVLTRATINIVLGRFETANEDCRRLHAMRRLDLGILCQSTALSLTADAPTIYKRLEALVATPRLLAPALRGYALGLMGEIAALQGRPELARTHFTTALAEDPGDLRVRMMLADVLLADGAPGEALGLLEDAPDVDGVLLRRAIAAERLDRPAVADPAKAELARRFRQNLDLGLTAHAREEARFFLEIARDPELALTRARVNWELQHEIEDAQLLIDAAVAADAPEAAAPVLSWIAEQNVSVPTLRIPDEVREAAR